MWLALFFLRFLLGTLELLPQFFLLCCFRHVTIPPSFQPTGAGADCQWVFDMGPLMSLLIMLVHAILQLDIRSVPPIIAYTALHRQSSAPLLAAPALYLVTERNHQPCLRPPRSQFQLPEVY